MFLPSAAQTLRSAELPHWSLSALAIAPFTKQRVADLAEVNRWIAERQREKLASLNR